MWVDYRFKKIAWIWSHHLQWKFKLLAGKFSWGNKAKDCWALSTNFWKQKVCWHHPAMLRLIFPPIIWIFTEGDGIESRLPLKTFFAFYYIFIILSKFSFFWNAWVGARHSMSSCIYKMQLDIPWQFGGHCFKNSVVLRNLIYAALLSKLLGNVL